GHGTNQWQLGNLEPRPVPLLLMQVIEGRLARLDEETRRQLQVAAIIGQDVPLELWQRVSAASDEALVAAIAQGQDAQLIEESSRGRYHFRHALLRLALYEELVAPSRRLWHRRVADALIETGNPDPDQVGYHLQQAGDGRAVEWLIRAGERAQRAYAWIAAAERFDAALAIMTEQGAPVIERIILLERVAELLRYGDTPRAWTLMNEAAKLALTEHELGLAHWCEANAALYQCLMSNVRAGLAEMERATDAFEALAPEERARCVSLLGLPDPLVGTLVMWLAFVGRLDQAGLRGERMLTTKAAPELRQEELDIGNVDGLFGLAVTQALLGQPEVARQTFQRAGSAYRTIEHHAMVEGTAQAELQFVQLPYYPLELESRRRLIAAAVAARQQQGATGVDVSTPWAPMSLPLLVIEGGWAEARAVATSAFGERDWYRIVIGAWLAVLARDQGDITLAKQLVTELAPDGPRTEPGNTLIWGMLRLQRLAAQLALDAQDLPGAHAWLEAHDRWLAWSGAVLGRAEGALAWAEYHHAGGDLARARRQAEEALAHASDPLQPLALLTIHRFLGQLDTEARQFDAAEEQFQRSLHLADACAAPFERALTLLALAELRTARGQTGEARALLDEVRTICTPLEARPTLARAEALAARLTAASRSFARYPAGLSAREVEVLRLVAQGLTDARIAEQLFVSRRTVSSHLVSIYNKLGVSSRAAATRFAVEQQLL
ncbi:MAG TPA: LuxR C-terminal-related transcriptional regulator, partial [Thermomicrobiaceae bacterium]|nr:LuxR C-terminal-related transcriptional regulator [Thermomicrobiaceae bacterium]